MSATATVPASVPSKRLVDTLSPAEKEKQINDLLKDLETATVSSEKKRIRRSLRSRGYYLSRQPKVEAAKVAEATDNAKKGAAVSGEIVNTFGNGASKSKGKKAKAKTTAKA